MMINNTHHGRVRKDFQTLLNGTAAIVGKYSEALMRSRIQQNSTASKQALSSLRGYTYISTMSRIYYL